MSDVADTIGIFAIEVAKDMAVPDDHPRSYTFRPLPIEQGLRSWDLRCRRQGIQLIPDMDSTIQWEAAIGYYSLSYLHFEGGSRAGMYAGLVVTNRASLMFHHKLRKDNAYSFGRQITQKMFDIGKDDGQTNMIGIAEESFIVNEEYHLLFHEGFS